MTWVILIWCALIVAWLIAGGTSADCGGESTNLNQDACEAGAGIGGAIVLFIGFIGFVFFSLIWFMTRPKGRPCPVCGDLVPTGATKCGKCGHDFAAAAQGTAAQPAAGWYPHPSGEQRYWNGAAWTEDRPPPAQPPPPGPAPS